MIPANLKPNSNLQASEPKIIQREKRMGEAMIIIYCKDNNNTTQYHCSICSRFEVYAKKKIGILWLSR